MRDDRGFLDALVGDGRPLLILSAIFLIACGGFAIFQASSMRLLPHDTAYLGMSADQLCRYQGCRILHFMIHDRISFGGVLIAIGVMYLTGFGGALASFGVAMFACLRYARPSRALWQALAVAGAAGFATAVGIHPVIGYLSVTHLAPAVLGMVVFAGGLILAISGTVFARP
jgi:hypothetical protein